MPGTLEAIWIKSAHRGPITNVEAARTVADSGLEGNINQSGKRQVTLLAAEAWEAATRELQRELDPILRRANLLVRGIDFEDSRERVVQVGTVTIRIHGETKPCQRMEQACPGLRAALTPHWRGGAYGVVIDDGEISVGDDVSWRESSAESV